jgi:predicted SnoaL-like aldol condensation-catalyzing enzyme
MSVDENKEIVRRWNEEIGPKDFDAYDEFLHKDYVAYHGSERSTREEMERSLRQAAKEHPTARIVIDEAIGEGDIVAVRATYLEDDAPTHSAMAFYRLLDGKIVEDWSTYMPLEE